ncbi:putative O-glycosylation ligase, exosortase A system-associated [Alteriqipengyuania flavescens]|uniref:putative O-glycosylation ligase, exosortase A system-associated n=1 Tax=Alteriqipengyuania flavescens TaxID=3053610 RepID=UPI0025B584B5|nr:putative O-glycosylation ligase, exosortase A system-associated [Alteriqipengyuania flavescens]WJY19407.1 putative O-glycosylation ligase, exosortase A system-associated [Alteriqipengyuania flavescens]WJY25349.1 putative O-glycosylation ligase, exosortase A system-associated [Alteriqipengyuania flavescens]
MLDLALVLFVLGLIALGLRRPFIWVLAYLYVDIVAPQKIGWTLMPSLKISLVTFVLAFGGWLLFDNKHGSRLSVRMGLMFALLAWCAFTTSFADFPEAAAEKWSWVWKSMLFALFLPLALRTKLRLEAAITVLVLSMSAIVISGGIKTIFGGGGYGVLVTLTQDNSGIYEGSTLSTAAIAVIPLIWWVARHTTLLPARHRLTMLYAAGMTFACLLIPVGTSTRTGLLCIAVLGLLLLRTVRHRFLYIGAAAALGLLSLPFLPNSFQERMGTITSYQADESASTRVQVWKWTLDFVSDKPLGGGFDAFLGNSFTYETVEKVDVGGGVVEMQRQEVTDEGRAFHSAYFEVLGEQGFVGFGLWALLHLTGLVGMERLRRRLRKSGDPAMARWAALANALQQVQVVFLFGSLFVGIAYQPFILIVLSMQIALAHAIRSDDARLAEDERKARLAQHRARKMPGKAFGGATA